VRIGFSPTESGRPPRSFSSVKRPWVVFYRSSELLADLKELAIEKYTPQLMNIKSKALKWILGVLATIVVGALGSGLWQNVFGPALHFVTRWGLDLASLGFASYKTSIYQQIAADNPSDVSVSALGLVTAIFILAVSWQLRYGFLKNNSERSRIQRTLSSLSASDVGSPISQESAAELRGRLERQLIALRKIRRTDLVFSGMVTVCLVSELIAWNRFSYINAADAHYHQVLRIASPYLAAGEQAQTDSDFAQIRTRQDYVNVLSKLESQCKAHGLTVPEFDPW
jgi:hypothetical protein